MNRSRILAQHRLARRWYSQENGAIKSRLSQLAEDSIPHKDDPKAGARDTNPLVEEMFNRIQNANTADLPISVSKQLGRGIPNYVSKEMEGIAKGDVWTGEETAEQVAKRLALDKHRKRTEVPVSAQLPKFKKRSMNEQLSQGRDKSLDYKVNKKSCHEGDGSSIKEQYVEKFMMASGASGSIATINSIASQRIQDAIERGQFKNLPRGQKLERDHHTSSPYIDTTEYFLNRMIKRQGAAPPWVETQARVYQEIDQLRGKLRRDWVTRAVKTLDQRTKQLSARAKLQHTTFTTDADRRDWERDQLAYHQLLVKDMNSTIRGYNIQAPQSARRGYISLSEELRLCYEGSDKEVVEAFHRHVNGAPPPPPKSASLQSKSRHELVSENPDNYYGFKHLMRDLFSRK